MNLKRLWLVIVPVIGYFEIERLQEYFVEPENFKLLIAIHIVMTIGFLVLFIDAIPGFTLKILDTTSSIDLPRIKDREKDSKKEPLGK